MPTPSHKAFLSELDSLSHGARLRRAALLARDHREDPALPPLLHQLLSGDAHEATLALEMARGARHGDTVLGGLTHPSCQVRGRYRVRPNGGRQFHSPLTPQRTKNMGEKT